MNQKSKYQGIGARLGNFIRKTDAFGTPVSFTYKKETCIKSFIGGFFTCLARLGVAIYLLIQCGNVLNRENIVQTTMFKRDLTVDATENIYTLNNFDYGLRLEYIFYETQPEIQENLDQYVYMQVTQNIYTWVKDTSGSNVFQKQKSKTDLGSCTNGRLGLNEGSKDYLGLKSGYQCPDSIDYRMKGSFAGEQSKFVQLRIGYCNQTDLNVKYNNNKKCKDVSEQLRVAANLKLYFVVQNSYFDTSDFSDNPIKTFLKPYYLTTKNYTSIYYYVLLSSNKAKYNNGMLFGTATEKEFVETRVDYQVTQEIPTSESTPNAFLSIYIQMDDSHKTISRQVTTFVDALQATGGFMTVIFVITTMVVGRFSKTIYYTSLIKSFYKYQKPQKAEGDEEFDNSDEDDNEKKRIANEQLLTDKAMQFKDKYKDEKEKIYSRLLDQINNRKKLLIGLATVTANKMKAIFCRKLTKTQFFRNLLYRRGIIKIEKELDIRTIAKQLKTLKFISQVMLTKYQKFMIAHFKENLLNHKNIKDKIVKKDYQKQLQKYLFKMIVNCNTSKMDARMIKNVDLSENDEILNELIEKGYAQDPNASISSKHQKSGSLTRRSMSKKPNKTFDDIRITESKRGADGANVGLTIDDLLIRQSKKGTKIFENDKDEGKTPKTNRNTAAEVFSDDRKKKYSK